MVVPMLQHIIMIQVQRLMMVLAFSAAGSITVTVGGGSWDSEIGWSLVDGSGTVDDFRRGVSIYAWVTVVILLL